MVLAILCVACLGARADEFAEAEQALQTSPKPVLDLVKRHLESHPISDAERGRWLALGSEAAYALALPDQAVAYAKEGLDRPELSPTERLRLGIAYAQGLDLAGQSPESVQVLMEVVATLEKGQFDRQFLVDALNARASAYYSTSNFRAALADLLRIYPLAPEHGHRTIRADVANALGNVYAAIEDNKNAIHFYRETIDYSVANKTWLRASIAEYSLATVYRRDMVLPKAAEYFEQARQHSVLIDDKQGIAYADFGLAQVALKQKKFELAEATYRRALPLFEEAKDILPQVNIHHGLAEIACEREQYQQCRQLTVDALKLLEETYDIGSKFRIQQLKADAEVSLGDYSDAYATLKQALATREQDLTARNSESLSEMRVRFDTQRQEQENALLLKENQLNTATLNEQRQTARLYAVSVVALLIILGFLAYLAHRNKQVRARLAAQALTDELTGVANRRHAMGVLAAEFERAKRYRTPLTVAMFDLDHFKRINDRFGHAAGDEVLKAFSMAMLASLRKTDCFGRIGGEEFLAILPHTDLEVASVVMDRMRHATLALTCPSLRSELQPSVSIGVTEMRDSDTVIEELVKRADDAVYRAKQGGRNRVERD